ncbi:TonB-dependent receptor [Flavobacterium alkalisoli]|uniref:TonB-dependent receptor n=1 Tax=Flavobacterium alkalisoli TaxID=2602769 RepID=A0A5B9FN21_9FLAO|nr:TonB-dependent receptor [Flavobacterium alkalisoli]QEE48673.1 TonB-dependent receptor [Flavobacterium alkalisoli]
MKKIIYSSLILSFFFSWSQEENITMPTINKASGIATAQTTGTVKGQITDNGSPLPYASIHVKETGYGISADENGNYSIKLPAGNYTLMVSAIGYKTKERTINITANNESQLNIELETSSLNLDQVVITASRSQERRQEAPVIVTVTNSAILQKTESLSLSEGLNFQPGLRMETNCQNCGFSQVRMNGLDGAYSQILLDSRPVFSALNGIYGLDQIPTNMIDRIEVVRGGGSALYGSNAIAGTINIITKDPVENNFEINSHLGLIDGKQPDKALTLNGTVLNEDLTLGMQVFGMLRDRNPYDANGDGFTEITRMENRTFGFKAFQRYQNRRKLTLDFHTINEFRRGGSQLDLQPFESDITEQIRSKMTGGGVTYEFSNEDMNNKYSLYANAQQSKNENFYGGRANDEFGNIDYEESIRGFGNTEVTTYITGAQWIHNQESFLGGRGTFTAGSEYKREEMTDRKPGYNAFVNQQLNILGIYAQEEWKVNQRLKLLGGLRADFHNAAQEDVVFNPRLNILYDIKKNLQWRTSYAKGFRAPQVFSEDIHARIAAGEVSLIRLSDNLKSETSNSFLTSLDWSKTTEHLEAGATIEAFYTRLNNPFILEQVGETLWEKRNGKGADVYGINIEGKFAPNEKWQMQAGATLQKALYSEAVDWSDNLENTNRNFFRSPNFYGNMIVTYAPKKEFQNNLTLVYTGSMYVPHYAGYIANDELKKTEGFTEVSWKSSYTFTLQDQFELQLSGGIQNIFNAYQKDFDLGVDRDASYIYGPGRLRTIFVGVKIGTNL